MTRRTVEDRLAAALTLVKQKKKWEARSLLLDELRASADRRKEVLAILNKHFPLSQRQRRALADLGANADGQSAAIDVTLDAPDPRFTEDLAARAEDDPRALEALLRMREAFAADALEELYPEPSDGVAAAIERIREGAHDSPPGDVDTVPPPPPDVPEDRLWGLVDEVRRADDALYGQEPAQKRSRKGTSRKVVRRARP